MGKAMVLLLAVVGGCGDDTKGVPDARARPADLPIAYHLVVGWYEPFDRAVPDPAPDVYIDGVARMSFDEVFPNREAAEQAAHFVELRYGDTVVRARSFTVDKACLGDFDSQATRLSEELCAYQSGDLRYGSSQGTAPGWTCVGDGLCAAECGPGAGPCAPTERCTSRASSTMPLATRLACAPIGPRQLGETCNLVPSARGAFDDCGVNLLCVEGSCRALCDLIYCHDHACRYVPGQPPELQLCP